VTACSGRRTCLHQQDSDAKAEKLLTEFEAAPPLS